MLLLAHVRAMRASAAASALRHTSLHRDARAFHTLGLDAELVRRLAERGVVEPTAAQKQAIPAILQHRDVVIAAETGGGKTLAYVLPLLTQLKQTHPVAPGDTHRPVALILTPTQELVRQVASVLAALAPPELAPHIVSISSTNQSLKSQRACPIVVATPAALLRASSPQDFRFTKTVVVDEADMLLSGGCERTTKQILATIRNQPLLKAQLNAYGTRSVRQYLDHKFPHAHFAVTEDFQRTLPRLAMRFYDLDALAPAPLADATEDATDDARTAARNALLWDVLRDAHEAPANTLVFANSVASADAAFAFVTDQVALAATDAANGLPPTPPTFPHRVLRFHKDVDRLERMRVLAELDDAAAHVVVVCTDSAARGLDTTTVRHVVQYDFASDVVSHLHRIGRTARAGTTGRVSNIVTRANALVVDKIRAAGAASLAGAFSRKRSLRKKAKKAKKQQMQEQ